MKNVFNRNILLILFLLHAVSCAFAYETSSGMDDEDEATEEEFNFEESFLKTDSVVSDWFNSVTEGVDIFLVGKKMVKKQKSKSEIVVTNTMYSRESQNLTNLTGVSINPRFPNLEAYWNLKFSTYDDTAIGNRPQGGYARQTPQEKKYAASLGLFRKLNKVRLAFQPRIELQDPLKVSHFLTLESLADFKKFQVNPKFQIFADASLGTGSFQALNFNFPLTDVYSIAQLNEGEYQERIHRFSVTNGVSLGQILNERQTLTYGISLYSNNQPTYHLDAYSFSVAWAHIIYKNLLDYQLVPHLDFVRDENFHGFVGLIFELNLRF
ncbi:MAG: hypothetical protein K0R29_962 [Pseudobdellovibrio sp.]|jgi:hypothetical protein|nr:hypothetical protein [Pseudobdellovibrio sp.]